MSLRPCKECGKEVSTKAASCPNCGAKVPRQFGVIGALFALFVGWILFSCVGEHQKREIAQNNKPAEQVSRESKEKDAEVRRFAAATVAEEAVKRAVRDPDSVRFNQMRVNADGSIVCAEFRAKNGFGGMEIERLVWVNGNPLRGDQAWLDNCRTATFNQPLFVR